MALRSDRDVIIIGGGLAGLTAGIMLSRAGLDILILEKGTYPSHKVCGEYISNEVLPFLKSLGLDPFRLGASRISRLRVSTPSGKSIYAPLDLGAFGLSRYVLDQAMCDLAMNSGAEVLTRRKVTEVIFEQNGFSVKTNTEEAFTAPLVIGSYGKRDTLDKQLERDFIQERTGYLGVKYHIRTDYPVDEIGLDNFEGGYCGISRIEDEKYNLCYLYRRPRSAVHKTIPDIQEHIMFQNPVIRNIFSHSDFLFAKPEVIQDFSFEAKSAVEDHILMCGDAAGLITPLCGNGMSMAIHGAKILSELLIAAGVTELTPEKRRKLESEYTRQWQKHFRQRLFWGRTIQGLFGNETVSEIAIRALHAIPAVERALIAATHGSPIGA
ncbi:MAG: NAD(P)/FAD-dependent oxidoreductase [Bacteroidetes bacterium]|nr:NAD(P)/FAD-dependent oxidoreductase [Bacteroidota bacterium]